MKANQGNLYEDVTQLFDWAGQQGLNSNELSPEESDYLNVLGRLVFEYEQAQELIPDIYGVELLKVLIQERQLRQKDLVPIFKTESIVSDILNGKRQLTVRHIQELAQFFNLSPAVFFPVQQNAKAMAYNKIY